MINFVNRSNPTIVGGGYRGGAKSVMSVFLFTDSDFLFEGKEACRPSEDDNKQDDCSECMRC